jgi:hypothetical protein
MEKRLFDGLRADGVLCKTVKLVTVCGSKNALDFVELI